MDLLARPELAAEPVTSLLIACWYWMDRQVNAPADRDDLVGVTRKVNGGTRGLAQRRHCLARAKMVLTRLMASSLSAVDDRPVLHRGLRGQAVADLQRMLAARGLRLAIDGDFGPATELAVRTWQESQHLDPDGLVGPRTWAGLLKSKVPRQGDLASISILSDDAMTGGRNGSAARMADAPPLQPGHARPRR